MRATGQAVGKACTCLRRSGEPGPAGQQRQDVPAEPDQGAQQQAGPDDPGAGGHAGAPGPCGRRCGDHPHGGVRGTRAVGDGGTPPARHPALGSSSYTAQVVGCWRPCCAQYSQLKSTGTVINLCRCMGQCGSWSPTWSSCRSASSTPTGASTSCARCKHRCVTCVEAQASQSMLCLTAVAV